MKIVNVDVRFRIVALGADQIFELQTKYAKPGHNVFYKVFQIFSALIKWNF